LDKKRKEKRRANLEKFWKSEEKDSAEQCKKISEVRTSWFSPPLKPLSPDTAAT
jgi:hypothetical protein